MKDKDKLIARINENHERLLDKSEKEIALLIEAICDDLWGLYNESHITANEVLEHLLRKLVLSCIVHNYPKGNNFPSLINKLFCKVLLY